MTTRRADSLSTAVIREQRTLTLPDGTTGTITGDFAVGGDVTLVMIVDGARRFVTVAGDALVEVGAS